MVIKSLKLINYRSYKDKTFNFSDKLNILVGKNAQGKTNVIEAIFYAVIGRSFKTSKEKEVIKWGENRAYIGGEFEKKIQRTKNRTLF